MYPYIHLFIINLPVYGLMVLTGFGAAFGLVSLRSEKFGVPRLDGRLITCMAFAGGIAGTVLLKPIIRLPLIFIYWNEIRQYSLWDFLRAYFTGEMVFYGGLIGGAVGVIWYCRQFGVSVASTAEIAAPAVPLAHAFGRLGCFFGGCCYGMEVAPNHLLAVVYPPRTDGLDAFAAPAGVPLLAIPLIEACGNLLIAGLVLLYAHRNKVYGSSLFVYGILYSVQRFIIEFYRGDALRGFLGAFSTSQYISLVIFTISVTALIIMRIKYVRLHQG
jgi:phosphatidylglycerol:prolipoprotein diacylglycerol transferase